MFFVIRTRIYAINNIGCVAGVIGEWASNIDCLGHSPRDTRHASLCVGHISQRGVLPFGIGAP